MKKLYITLILCFLSISISFGQEKKGDDVRRTYYYSFSNVSSIDQVENLKEDIEELKSVVKVKTEYKVEKGAGQVVVVVLEKTRTSEGQVFFSITDLKRLIVSNDLIPNELKQEETILQK